jgi:hypothetical protein
VRWPDGPELLGLDGRTAQRADERMPEHHLGIIIEKHRENTHFVIRGEQENVPTYVSNALIVAAESQKGLAP